jgi:hypothetical protein
MCTDTSWAFFILRTIAARSTGRRKDVPIGLTTVFWAVDASFTSNNIFVCE